MVAFFSAITLISLLFVDMSWLIGVLYGFYVMIGGASFGVALLSAFLVAVGVFVVSAITAAVSGFFAVKLIK